MAGLVNSPKVWKALNDVRGIVPRLDKCIRDELLVRHTVLIIFRPRLSGEQCGEFLVKVDEVLGVLPSLKFVLATSQLITTST